VVDRPATEAKLRGGEIEEPLQRRSKRNDKLKREETQVTVEKKARNAEVAVWRAADERAALHEEEAKKQLNRGETLQCRRLPIMARDASGPTIKQKKRRSRGLKVQGEQEKRAGDNRL